MSVFVLCLRVIDCDVSNCLDMPSLKSLVFGEAAFNDCSRVVFESE